MLQGLRNAGKSWTGKIIGGVLFFLLIVSFAIWGIGDIFRGGVSTTVARVGEVEITAADARATYQRQIQQLSARFRQPITPEQARMFGVDAQVLSQLVTEATLDERTRQLGLRVSDELVARSTFEDPMFQGPAGQFDRNLFNRLLYSNNITEQRYVAEQRAVLARQQLADSVAATPPVPIAAREAVHRYAAERRAADYLVLGEAVAGEIPAPTQEQLQAFYEENREAYRAPEYRALTILSLSPAAIADPAAVAPEEARARYEELREARYTTPERRTVQQIPFPSAAEAAAAAQRIAATEVTFEEVAAERGVSGDGLTLGTFARNEFVDSAIAEAAFVLAEGAIGAPVEGRFGASLLRVTQIVPATVRPIEEVEEEIRREIAMRRASDAIQRIYDEVEDLRATARPLAEIAREKNLPYVEIPAVDPQGRDKAGAPVDQIPERDTLLPAAFASDVGVDNMAIRTPDDGYVWFDVTAIEPARTRDLAEVAAAVDAAWRQEQIATRLAERARDMVQRVQQGVALETVAAEVGLGLASARELARGQAQGDLTADAVAQIFATPVGQVGTAAVGETGRVVFRVAGATAPQFLTTTPQAATLETRLRSDYAQDLLGQYIAQLQQEIGIQVNEAAFRQALSGEF